MLVRQEVHKELLVIIRSDKGLCGSYNMNIFGKQKNTWHPGKKGMSVWVSLGERPLTILNGVNFPLNLLSRIWVGTVDYARISEVAKRMTRYFVDGTMNEINLLHTNYISTMRYQPILEPYLPFRFEEPQK